MLTRVLGKCLYSALANSGLYGRIAKGPKIQKLPQNPHIQRILVIKWSALGDVVMASAIIEDIYRAFPGRKIHLNILPPWDRLFAQDSRFTKVFAIDLRRRKDGVRAAQEWLAEVRAGDYDLVIDLQTTDRSRLLLSMLWFYGAQIPYRIGNHLKFPYNIGPGRLPNPVHPSERMRAALNAGGIPTTTPRPVLFVPQRNRERVYQMLAGYGLMPGNYALFFPGSQAAGHLKRWGAERYAALARELNARALKQVVLIGDQDELEECQKIQAACGDYVVNLCGQTEILDIVPLAEGARLMVGNDTGTAHIASAAATPMVVICGPTDPRKVKPLGDNVVAVQLDLPCINCYLKECSHHSCMVKLAPAMIMEKLLPISGPAPTAQV